MKHNELKVREFARRERVDIRTVKRWIQKGAIDVRKTPGGGVRVLVSGQNRDNGGHLGTS